MQPNPRTPSKADDGIERVKQALCTKWGIQLPERDLFWSPSRRNPDRPEEKISTFIQFLYFRDGALDTAIHNFEQNAANIHSEWQYKPKADPDVIPGRERSKHGSRETFLRKRDSLPEAAVKELRDSLLHNLWLIVERVKSGEKFSKSGSVECPGDPVKSSIEHHLPIKPVKPLGQSNITKWFRNKSAPGASIAHDEAAQHFSSDDYPDSEMADIIADGTITDTAQSWVAAPAPRPTFADSGEDSPTLEDFKTPPTTPPRSGWANFGLGINLQDRTKAHEDTKMACSTIAAIRAPSGSKKRPLEYLEPMRPPPTRKTPREKQIDQNMPRYTAPTPPPENHYFPSRSSSTSRSFGIPASISSSFSSASPAWSSPNTSFCSSVATSFDSAAEETDTTIIPSFGQSWSKLPIDQFSPWLRPESTSFPASEGGSKTRYAHEVVDPESARQDHDQCSATEVAQPVKGSIKPDSKVAKQLLGRLISYTPFVPLPNQYSNVPLRQLYEVIRISINCGLPLSDFSSCLDRTFEQYAQLWTALVSAVPKIKQNLLPERSSLEAWNRAGNGFEGVALTGKLKFLEQASGPVFELSLHPLKLESSYRFARKFGHDRFCVVLLPSLCPDGFPQYLKPIQAAARDVIIKWLVETEHCLLGRTWRVFYVKPESTKKGHKGVKNNAGDARWRVNLFAEDGVNFRDVPIRGEADPRTCIHSRIMVRQLLDWHMPPEENSDQTVLKFFNRLGLGLTNTTPTLEFRPEEIVRSDDAHPETANLRKLDLNRSEDLKTGRNLLDLDTPVMNDGCARISRDAAMAVANMLGMDQAPSVFQGRIGGAKGVWMVDALDERPPRLARADGRVYWIEVTDSQLKFKPHRIDALSPEPERITFEVNKYSKKLSASSLSFQLIPILEDRGVPQEVFRQLLREDLSSKVGEMEVAVDDGLSLRKWNQDTNPVTQERAQFGGIEMAGGLPESTAERINWFVEHGFEPKTCRFLKEQLWKSIRSYCMQLESRMNIGLGRSTSAFMIADPLGILEEGEIHVGFSNIFRDAKSGFNESMLHDIDVLVARLPARLPSDIQKVRATFKPELRIYRDVVVFSSKGEVSLASKLSGGDYDGDTAWICWEPEIVDPFTNAKVPDFAPIEAYGIEKDKTKVSDLLSSKDYTNRFLQHAFQFNLQMSMLGICSNYHESLCYRNNNIDSPEAISIGVLLSYLVDSAKGGFKFDDTQWTANLKQLGLDRILEQPAYKDRMKSREKEGNLIDQLVFHVAKEEREKALKNVAKHLENVSFWDEDLVALQKQEAEEAKTNGALQSVLENLKAGLDEIRAYWTKHAKREDEEDDVPSSKRGAALSFRSVVEQCRGDFLALSPTIDKAMVGESSDTVGRWQRDHSMGRSSYWDLLKASSAYFYFHTSVSFIWHVAGVELGEIKVTKAGRGTYRCVINHVFDTLKLDGKLVNGAKRKEMQLEELRKVEGDDDDEFGSDVDMMHL